MCFFDSFSKRVINVKVIVINIGDWQVTLIPIQTRNTQINCYNEQNKFGDKILSHHIVIYEVHFLQISQD